MSYETPEIFELGDAEKLTLAVDCGWLLDILDYPRIPCRFTEEIDEEKE